MANTRTSRLALASVDTSALGTAPRITPGTVLGHTRAGRPILAVGGGDQRADLLTRKDELLAELSADTLTAEDATRLAAEADQVRSQLEAYNAAAMAAANARAALAGASTDSLRTSSRTPAPVADDAPAAETRSWGARIVQSDQLRDLRARNYSGQVAIELPGSVRALIDNSATSGGAFQNPSRPTDVPQANLGRVPRLADLIDRRPTDGNTVEYVQETTAVDGGGVAAETAEGGLKPEATFTFTVITDSVRTIAHWTNITRQAADDNAQLQGYVEGRLGYGLEVRLDSQILNGNGTSPNLRGILNTPGRGTYTAPAGEAAIISVRRAMTVAQQSEYAPDTLVTNPVDWERIELSTDSAGLFRVTPNVANALAPRVWGLNVVPTTAIAGTVGGATPSGGRFVVGSFRMGATLWERDGIRVLMTDSHASNFTSNILTLLAEMRAALSVWRPRAFVDGTYSTGTA